VISLLLAFSQHSSPANAAEPRRWSAGVATTAARLLLALWHNTMRRHTAYSGYRCWIAYVLALPVISSSVSVGYIDMNAFL